MEREEAIKILRETHDKSLFSVRTALETLIPELKESEDERIRKFLVKHVSEWIGCIEHDLKLSSKDVESEEELAMFKACLAYLERQKEPLIPEEKMNHPLYLEGFDVGKKVGEVLKEQKPEEGTALQKAFISSKIDYTLEEKCDASDYADAILPTSVTYGENEEEYKLHKIIEAAFIAGQKKEQQPAEWSEEDKSILNNIIAYKVLNIDDLEWLKSLPERFNLQPKPKVEYDNETEIQKAYREGKNAGRKEVFDHPEYYGLQLRRMYDYETGKRNPEWSEEDEKMAYFVNQFLGYHENADPTAKSCKDWFNGRLKSFRPQPKQEWSKSDEEQLIQIIENGVTEAICKEGFRFHFDEDYAKNLVGYIKSFSPQPHWKPSEEQLSQLQFALNILEEKCGSVPNVLWNLCDELKKL